MYCKSCSLFLWRKIQHAWNFIKLLSSVQFLKLKLCDLNILIGWIPGIRIGITFFCSRFLHFQKFEMIQWNALIPVISKFWSDSLVIRFWNFCLRFEIAWVAPICVVNSLQKSPHVLIFLRQSFSYLHWVALIWFYATQF